ncbi:MAG: TonB-dependent receptor [Mucilaginibacter sp.]
MNLKYIYTLLTLLIALCFVPAHAQTNRKAKKPAAVVKKKPAKTVKNQQKANAKSLGDAAAKTSRDTVKKGGQNTNAGASLSEEIVVTTAYKPVLADAVKIRRNPDLEDKTPFKAPLTYFPIDKRLELNSSIKPLEAMKRPAERDSTLANNYIKAGFGSMKTTYGEAYFGTGRDPGLQFGGYLKHFAQQGTMYKQNSAKENAGVFVKSIGAENEFTGRVTYNYNSNYFYGYDPANPVKNLQVNQQHFSTVAGEAEFAKNYKDVENDFTYAFKLKGYIFNDAFQAKENNVVLSGFLNETVNQFYAGLSGSLDFSTQQDNLYNYNNSLIRLNPYIKFQGDSYKVDAGVSIVDQFGFSSAFYIFPAAKAELQVIPTYVRVFVEAKGDVNKSSLLDFSTINPFLGQNLQIKNSVDQLDLSAGLKGTLAPGLGFKATIFRNSVKNMPLFVSDFDFSKGYNRFKVIYDGGRSRVNGFTGELDLKASDNLDLFGRVEFKDYQMATVAQPWNLPKFKLTAGTVIHISSLVDVTGSLLIRGNTMDPHPISSTNPTPTTIGSFADLSGGVQYKASSRFVVFVHVNNLLNGTNQTWLYYPDYGFNVFGGVGFSF